MRLAGAKWACTATAGQIDRGGQVVRLARCCRRMRVVHGALRPPVLPNEPRRMTRTGQDQCAGTLRTPR